VAQRVYGMYRVDQFPDTKLARSSGLPGLGGLIDMIDVCGWVVGDHVLCTQ